MNDGEYVEPTDYLSLLRYGSSVVIGIAIAILARSVWIEVAWIDYRGTDNWFGWLVMASGFVISASGATRVFVRFRYLSTVWAAVVAALCSLIPIGVASVVGLRKRQISAEIRNTAKSPERWFEGTMLEELGDWLADLGDSLSDPLEPRLTDQWRWLLVLGVVSLVLSLLQMPWSQFRPNNHLESLHN